jgi:hypothetical protein
MTPTVAFSAGAMVAMDSEKPEPEMMTFVNGADE